MYGAYTLLDATYKGTGDDGADAANGIFSGNDVTGIADSMWVLSADFTGELFTAGLSAKSTGSRAVNTANTWFTDEYVLVDAFLSIAGEDLAEDLTGWRIHAQVHNLTGKEYEGVVSSNAIWLGAPRTATVGVTIDF